MTKFEAMKSQFIRAIKRLDEVLKEDKNEFIRDSAIQRFEFTFDLSWKCIKHYLDEEHGVVCTSPKGCFRDAYKNKMIEYDTFWLEMTDMRNQTSHTYKEDLAEEIFKKLPKTLKYFKELLEVIKKKET